MTRTRLAFVFGLMLTSFTSTAHADLAPPRIERPKPSLPHKVKAWFAAAKAAMTGGNSAQTEKLCDPRGFEVNLVGGDGTTLASLFGQGHRKRWHLRGEPARSKAVKAQPGSGSTARQDAYIAAADVVDDAKGNKLDSLFILLVPGPGDTFVALGASESKEPIEALAKRWQDGKPLPPTED